MAERVFFSELLPTDECASVIEKTGMGIELIRPSVGMNLDRYPEMMREIRSDLVAWGEPAVSVHGPFLDLNPMSYERMVQEAAMYRFNQAYDAAMELSAERLVLHSGMIPTTVFLEGWAERMTEFWNRFMDGKTGLTVCMENVFDPRIEPFAQAAEKVESPWFGICLDIGHANCYSEHKPQTWAKALQSKIRHLHIHDNNGDRDAHLAIGCGNIDTEKVLSYMNNKETMTIENSSIKEVLESYKKLTEKASKPLKR